MYPRGVQVLMLDVSRTGKVSSLLSCLIVFNWNGPTSCLFHSDSFRDSQAICCFDIRVPFLL